MDGSSSEELVPLITPNQPPHPPTAVLCFQITPLYCCPLSSPVLLLFFPSWFAVPEAMVMTQPLCYIMNSLLSALFLPSPSLQLLPLGFTLAIVLNTFRIIWLTQFTFFQIPAFCLCKTKVPWSWDYTVFQGWHVYWCLFYPDTAVLKTPGVIFTPAVHLIQSKEKRITAATWF